MELKRTVELSLCQLLQEALPTLIFYPSRGGSDDITPNWEANHGYFLADILRPTDHSKRQAIVVNVAGNSGAIEPAWDDTPGTTFGSGGEPRYKTTANFAIDIALDTSAPEPPFGVVSIDEAEKTLAQEQTSYLRGQVIWITRANLTPISKHSRDFKSIYDALCTITPGYDLMRRLTIHGVDVTSTDEFTDAERQAHGDVVSFTIGVTERPAQFS